MATEISGPSDRARSRASSSRLACHAASMVRRRSGRPGNAATASSAAWGASVGIGLRSAGTGSALARAISAASIIPADAIRAARLRRLGKGHQQGRLAERQSLRLLAEIRKRGGANPFEIAAIGGQAQIEREHFILGELPLD